MKNRNIIILIVVAVAVLAGAIFLFNHFQRAASEKRNIAAAPTPAPKTTFKERSETIQELLAQKFSWPVDKVQAQIADENGNFMKGTVTLVENDTQTVKIGNQSLQTPKINLQGLFLAVNSGGNWQIVWAGAGIYDCQTASRYKFPAAMVGDCQPAPAK